MSKDRAQAAAARKLMLFLLLGAEMALVAMTLLYSAAGMAAEQDRERFGTLQALGVTGRQLCLGQALQGLCTALTAVAAANLTLALIQLAAAAWSGQFRLTLLRSLEAYPWTAHWLVCLAAVLAVPLLQSLPIRRVARLDPIENIRS